MCINSNNITTVIATDNWLLKISLYSIDIAHQSDTSLTVISSDTHNFTHDGMREVQFINIKVTSTRPGLKPFVIRMKALDFRDLQTKYTRPITILPHVHFHKSLIDRFIDVFREQAKTNPVYDTNQVSDFLIILGFFFIISGR